MAYSQFSYAFSPKNPQSCFKIRTWRRLDISLAAVAASCTLSSPSSPACNVVMRDASYFLTWLWYLNQDLGFRVEGFLTWLWYLNQGLGLGFRV